MQAPDETFEMQVVAPSGFASQDQFEITVDQTPPRIEFEAPPPSVTAVEWLPLRGKVEGGAALLVDGQPTQLIDEAFDQTVTLKQGANRIELVASDLVGNVGVEKLEIVLDQEPPQLIETVGLQGPRERRRHGDRERGRERPLGHEAGGAVHPPGRRPPAVRLPALQQEPVKAIVQRSSTQGRDRPDCS